MAAGAPVCAVGVVYEIPLSCGRNYRGRWFNERLLEHAIGLPADRGRPEALLQPRAPAFDKCRILRRHKGQRTSEIVEAYAIRRRGPSCVSVLSLIDMQLNYLGSLERDAL